MIGHGQEPVACAKHDPFSERSSGAAGWAFEALAACGALYTVAAALVTVRFLQGSTRSSSLTPSITLIKPLHGAHTHLREALEGFCVQDYAGEVQIVFGVADGADPAVEVVRDVQVSHPHLDIELVVDDEQHGVNRKASNLVNIARRARNEVLILSDADIVVDGAYLKNVVGALDAPGVGAVSCLYVGLDEDALWSRMSAMAIDYQFLPGAVLGKVLGLAQPCFGSTIALRREVLERIGGFLAVADHLADDYEIGRAVRALGLRVEIPPMVVFHHSPEESLHEVFGHELRWARTVRQIDAGGHAGSLITHPLPLSLIGAGLLGFPLVGLAFAGLILILRIGVKALVDAATGARAGAYTLIPLRDVLSFVIFIGSFLTNTVGWQGRRFRVGRRGALLHPE